MSLYRLPKGGQLRLKKIQRDFLWGGGGLERKINLIQISGKKIRKESEQVQQRCSFALGDGSKVRF